MDKIAQSNKQVAIKSATIAIDASRTLHPQPTGIEIYSREIIVALLRQPESANYHWQLLAPRLPNSSDRLAQLPNYARWVVVPGQKLWTLYYLSQYFRRYKTSINLLFVPSHTLPIITPPRTVVTIHDLAYRYYPENYGAIQSRWIDHELARSIRKATSIIVPSQATADDIIKYYRTPVTKIHVVPHGIDHQTTGEERVDLTSVSGKVSLKEPYFVVIGRIEPRKNSLGIAKAYQQALDRRPDLPTLVYIGRPGSGGEELVWRIRALPATRSGKIHLIGYQTAVITRQLLTKSQGLIFPSLYEGFGMTILEAMDAGVPVMTSASSALPETAGNAALLVDPTNQNAIAEGIIRLAIDEKLRKKLVKAGTAWVKRFTWDRAARETLEILVQSLS